MIKGLVITDFMAIAKLELELTAPLNFIAGHNEAGKSSIRDALLWGFTGQARGLKTHGDQAALIREGAKAAEVSIYLADGHAFTRRKTQKTAAAIMGAEANPRYLALWQTLLLTGCRRKEVVTLTWTDIDLPGRRIEITTTKNKGNYILDSRNLRKA